MICCVSRRITRHNTHQTLIVQVAGDGANGTWERSGSSGPVLSAPSMRAAAGQLQRDFACLGPCIGLGYLHAMGSRV